MSDWIVIESAYLTQAQQENNAIIIAERFRQEGWSYNAIGAILGNMQVESTINPGIWQNNQIGVLSNGFGLVQWTPSTKLRNWILATYGSTDYTNGNYQLDRILYELDSGIQYAPQPGKGFPETFREWSISTQPPGYLAAEFMINYERPKNQSVGAQQSRAELGEKWYTFLTGITPTPWTAKLDPLTLILIKKKRRFFD